MSVFSKLVSRILAARRPWRSLYFHHIGKTGGISLGEMIEFTLGAENTFPQRGVSVELLSDISRFTFFTGHFPFNVIEFLPKPIAVVTTVREPVSHIVSIYNHLRRSEGHHLLLARRTRPLESFDDFLNDEILRQITTNPQAYSLGRQITQQQVVEFAKRIRRVDWSETGGPDDFWCLYGSLDEDRQESFLLEVARSRIGQPWLFAYLCEKINAELELMFADLHLSLPRKFLEVPLRRNVRPSDPRMLTTDLLSESQVGEILLRTELDRKLYKHVLRLRENSL